MIKRILLITGAAAILATSCGGEKEQHQTKQAKGGVYYGGVFRINELEDFKSLYPLSIADVISWRISTQVYEGLIKFNQGDLSPIPALASRWESNTDATVWKFYLRKGVKFHNDPCFPDGKGRELTITDVKYCLDKLCENSPLNASFDVTFKGRVKGADEYFEASKIGKLPEGGVSGVKVLNDSTLEIDLVHPFSEFFNIIAHSGCFIYPKEAFEKYGIDMRAKCVGTGAFMVKTIKEGETVILEKNQDYWGVDKDGNQLPYLDAIKISFIKEKKAEMLEFQRGNLDLVYRIPVEMYKEIMGTYDNANAKKNDFDIQTVAALQTTMYSMLFTSNNIFSTSKDIRLAFNYALDRNKLVDYILQGEGLPGSYGIVPPVNAFKKMGYDFSQIKGYEFDAAKAKEYMKKAGYPDGKGFPKVTLTINSGGGERNEQIAEAAQKMWKENLGVEVAINVIPLTEMIDAYSSAKLPFYRRGWAADYPDPEIFLTLYYSKNIPNNLGDRSYINSDRYKNTKFDSLYTLALGEVDQKKRMTLYMQADQLLIDDGAFIPVFYDETDRLIQKNIRNFPANSLEFRDLSTVYVIPNKKGDK
ncbi:MAG: ABC transporter substrate-binding protein [Bacteroidetes bacterium]|nr:ABC transporter substrate-binding protein [Bacteroidota bacterium]